MEGKSGQEERRVAPAKSKYEDRMAVVEMALEDYGLKIKWMEKGLYLSDLLGAEDNVSIEDDDTS